MEPQINLFPNLNEHPESNIRRSSSSKANSLIISKQVKKPLSKAQETFNKRIKQLENLRLKHLETKNFLDKSLQSFNEVLYPKHLELIARREKFIEALFKCFQSEKLLTKKQRSTLKDLISAQLSFVLNHCVGEPSDSMKTIFKAIENISYKDAQNEDLETMKNDLIEDLEDMGVNVKSSDFDHDMSIEEMMQKMLKLKQQFEASEHQENTQRAQRKKLSKQVEKELRQKQTEELKTKSISSVYKQLARVFHPDLEQDPILKLEKEELMKELTAAHKKGDLHALLRLELKWLHREENKIEALSDEKLSLYNDVLKEQIDEARTEFEQLEYHPRYAPVRELEPYIAHTKHFDLEKNKKDSDSMLESIDLSIQKLSGPLAKPELKVLIQTFSHAQKRVTINLSDFDW